MTNPKIYVTTYEPDVGDCLMSYADWGAPDLVNGLPNLTAGGTDVGDKTVGFVSVAGIAGPHTDKGIGTDSTLADALAAYPGSVFVPATADYYDKVRWATGGTWLVFESVGDHGKSNKISGFTVGNEWGQPLGGCPG